MYASGNRAKGVCDICGFTCKYKSLRALVQNGRTTSYFACPDCYEQDHPLNTIPQVRPDAEIIRNPRPDLGLAESRNIAWGFNPVFSAVAKGKIGTVKVS